MKTNETIETIETTTPEKIDREEADCLEEPATKRLKTDTPEKRHREEADCLEEPATKRLKTKRGLAKAGAATQILVVGLEDIKIFFIG